jgi:hypothetical protein
MILLCRDKPAGYELSLMSHVYAVLSGLYSRHVKFSYARQDAELLMAKTKRFANILAISMSIMRSGYPWKKPPVCRHVGRLFLPQF